MDKNKTLSELMAEQREKNINALRNDPSYLETPYLDAKRKREAEGELPLDINFDDDEDDNT